MKIKNEWTELKPRPPLECIMCRMLCTVFWGNLKGGILGYFGPVAPVASREDFPREPGKGGHTAKQLMGPIPEIYYRGYIFFPKFGGGGGGFRWWGNTPRYPWILWEWVGVGRGWTVAPKLKYSMIYCPHVMTDRPLSSHLSLRPRRARGACFSIGASRLRSLELGHAAS